MRLEQTIFLVGIIFSVVLGDSVVVTGQEKFEDDFFHKMQFEAVDAGHCEWCHWGSRSTVFSNWTNHSNRLIPVYTWGMRLDGFAGANSCYRDEQKLKEIYGRLPAETLNPKAEYFDQTDIYRLQEQAYLACKKNIIVMVFDGMDWQTTQAAAIYNQKKVGYREGRGNGLAFLDYQNAFADFGYCVTSPHNSDSKIDVDAQAVTVQGERGGGYSWQYGGSYPWSEPADASYLLGQRKTVPHSYTDSAASATSLFSGIKTYNSGINIAPDGRQVEPIARKLQKKGYAIGVVTSVPISHATPACAYSNNVTRNDYQDLSRDLLGLRSVAHRKEPLPGVDVLIGCGFGEESKDDFKKQGTNYVPGNKYLSSKERKSIDAANGGLYQLALRTKGESGREVLFKAAATAALEKQRLFGYFGGSHLPYRTADGNYDPTRGKKTAERYSSEDLLENPTLADMSEAALRVLGSRDKGFWLMIEAGDVDWANHNNNLDDSIGAVISGDMAFQSVVKWVETHSNWSETALILTADHGHLLFVDDLEVLAGKLPAPRPKAAAPSAKSEKAASEKAKSEKESPKNDVPDKAVTDSTVRKAKVETDVVDETSDTEPKIEVDVAKQEEKADQK